MANEADIVIETINQAVAMHEQLTAQQQLLNQRAIDAGETQASAQEEIGRNQEIVQRATAAAELHNQALNAEAAAALGVNMDSTNQVVTNLGMRAMESLGRINALTDQIQQRRNTTLREDPIGFLYSSAILPEMGANLKSEVAGFQQITNILNQLNNSAQNQIQTNNALKAKFTGESAEAAAQIVAQDSAQKAAKIKQENLKYGLDSITAVMSANKAKLDGAIQIYQVRNSEEAMKLRKAEFELSSKRFNLELEKKLKEKASEEELVISLNKGRARLGLPPVATNQALQLLRLPGTTGDTFRKQFELGLRIDATGQATFGSDPGEAILLLNASDVTLPPEQKKVQTFIEQAIHRIRSDPINKNLKPDEMRAKINETLYGFRDKKKVVVGELGRQAAIINPGDESNIYQAPSFEFLADQSEVKNSNFGKVVLTPLATVGIKTITSEDMLSKAVAAIKNKQISLEDAAYGIEVYYKAAVGANNVNRRYIDFSLPEQTTYKAPVASMGVFRGSEVLDLTKQEQIVHYLVTKIAREKMLESGSGGSFLMAPMPTIKE